MIPVYFRDKNTKGGLTPEAQSIPIFWPAHHCPQEFFGNQLMVRRAEGLKLLTETDFGTLINFTLKFLRLLKLFNSRESKRDPPDDLLAFKILDAKSALHNLRESHRANLVVTQQAFPTDNVETAGEPSFYTFKNARTRLWLPNHRAIRLSNNVLTKLPSSEHILKRCRQALGFEIQGEKLVAVLDDQSKVDIVNLNALYFVLNRPFLPTGEPALNFVKALSKALYVAELFPPLKGRFLVNIEGVLLNLPDFLSVFDISTLLEILGVKIDSTSGLSEAINFQEFETPESLLPKRNVVVDRVKITLDPARSIYAAENGDFLDKQWVAAVSYLILYLRAAQRYLVGCEIKISSGGYYTILEPGF